jgi:hypothetical protein
LALGSAGAWWRIIPRFTAYASLTVKFNSFPHFGQLNVRISKSDSAGSIRESKV